MESIANGIAFNHDPVSSPDLISRFMEISSSIDMLSLDCFDTLLWRKTSIPVGVFYDLQHSTACKNVNFTPDRRMKGELQARQAAYVLHDVTEVDLLDIYQTAFPGLSATEYQALIEAEIAAEIDACYAFSPIVELMRAAHQAGKKIIIVSNTYLNQLQLSNLLKAALPRDVFAMIDRIFCSCDFARSKETGLFSCVLNELKIASHNILHLGDNYEADVTSSRALGLKAWHFLQHDKKITEIIRLQSLALNIADPTTHDYHSIPMPFRGVFGLKKYDIRNPETTIGYFSLGPIMYGFARYISNELDLLAKQGKHPKVLFLMRDGYLPLRAFQLLRGEQAAQALRLSRFTAIAASFRTLRDIHDFIINNYKLFPIRTLCHQLLLPDDIAQELIQRIKDTPNPFKEFVRLVEAPEISGLIFQNTAAYRQRLIKYLQTQIGLKANDTIMIVDLGYFATVQRNITPFLKDELNIEVLGRYLMSSNDAKEPPNWPGLIDSTHYDPRMVSNMLFANVSLFEELCTNNEDTVVNYNNEGQPIFSPSSISTAQRQRVQLIQELCLSFVRDAKDFFANTPLHFSEDTWRIAMLAELARSFFLPTKEEYESLKNFSHAVDRGTTAVLDIYDNFHDEQKHFRKTGLVFYKHPYVLRHLSTPLLMTYMLQRRYSFELKVEDVSLEREWLKWIMAEAGKFKQEIVAAVPTHDGFFAAWMPVTSQTTQLAILFGVNYKTIQFVSAELIKTDDFLTQEEKYNAIDYLPYLRFNEMTDLGDHLYSASSTSSSLMAQLTALSPGESYYFRVIYRPIVYH